MVPSSSQAGAWPTLVTSVLQALAPVFRVEAIGKNTLCEVADGMCNMMILTTWPGERHPSLLGHMCIDVPTLVFVSTSADLIKLVV